jgi:hypothetical protein
MAGRVPIGAEDIANNNCFKIIVIAGLSWLDPAIQ